MRKKIQSKIDDIKTKPLEERNRYARIAALTTTILVIIVWLTILAIGGGSERKLIDMSNIENLIQQATGEATDIGNVLSEQKDYFIEARDQLQQQEQTEEPPLLPDEFPEQSDEISITDNSLETEEEMVEESTNTTQL